MNTDVQAPSIGLGRPVMAACMAGAVAFSGLALLVALLVWRRLHEDDVLAAEASGWLDTLVTTGIVTASMIVFEAIKLGFALRFGARRAPWTRRQWQGFGLAFGMFEVVVVAAVYLVVYLFLDGGEPWSVLVGVPAAPIMAMALALLWHLGFSRGWTAWRAGSVTALIAAGIHGVDVPNVLIFQHEAPNLTADIAFSAVTLCLCLALWRWAHRRAVALEQAAKAGV
jgi:hypothetical protein